MEWKETMQKARAAFVCHMFFIWGWKPEVMLAKEGNLSSGPCGMTGMPVVNVPFDPGFNAGQNKKPKFQYPITNDWAKWVSECLLPPQKTSAREQETRTQGA